MNIISDKFKDFDVRFWGLSIVNQFRRYSFALGSCYIQRSDQD